MPLETHDDAILQEQSTRTAELVSRLRARGDDEDAVLVEELARRAHQYAHASQIDEQLRRSQRAFLDLACNKALSNGRQEEAFAVITEKVTQVLDVASVGIWLYTNERRSITCMDAYHAQTAAHERDQVLWAQEYPIYFDALQQERVVAAHDAYTDPRTSEFASTYLPATGVGALLDAPIRVGGHMIGVLCAEHMGKPRNWTTLEEHMAGAAADFVALAIESRQRAERERELSKVVELLEQRNSVIQQQQVAIADLSVPLVDVWDGIVALPIVGTVDQRRSEIMTEQLLERIAGAQVRVVIVDVTGVETIDASTANHLMRMLQAVSLLGATSMLSGITPTIARTLIELDIDLSSIRTVRNLAGALRMCLGSKHIR